MTGLSPPNISPQPRSRNPSPETAKTIKFFDKIFTVFFDLANPDSRDANPKFIKNTNIVASNTHRVSIAISILIINPPHFYLLHKNGAR
jgi:hypothetical protein